MSVDDDILKEEKKFCPMCVLENIRTKLKFLSDNILGCPMDHWMGKGFSGKLIKTFNCPRCAFEDIKSELKNYPNHLLTCRNCQWVGKKIGETLVETLI